ncbi:MAG: hypothetical protein IKF80_06730 [Erysipelotrichaceae bacterium]|nr:hypothetical protein [Erysipelotrichaceae bacterium]
MNRKSLRDDELDNVNGGVFVLNSGNKTLKYTDQNNIASYHEILDFDEARRLIDSYKGQDISEEIILRQLIKYGYILP